MNQRREGREFGNAPVSHLEQHTGVAQQGPVHEECPHLPTGDQAG